MSLTIRPLTYSVCFWIVCSMVASATVSFGQENNGPNAQALESMRQRAEQGDTKAQASLGMAYFLGAGAARQDDLEAGRWLRKAAEQGDALGESGLAAMYEGGRGMARDFAAAAHWYRKAAEQ